MKFIKIHDNRTNIDYPWMADINSLQDLVKIEECFCARNARDIYEFLGSKDFHHELDDVYGTDYYKKRGGDHCHPRNKLAPYLASLTRTLPENQTVYPLIYFAQKVDETILAKIKYLERHGRILINQNDGFMTWCSTFKETDSIQCNRFPQYAIQDVKVSKWPAGTHWYLTIHGTSIVVDGREKWQTEQEAMDAVKKWMGK